MSFATNNNDEILVDASDQPIDCTLCPPCLGIVPCCVAGQLPATKLLSYNINASILGSVTMNKVGNGYSTPSPTVLCDFGDGHNIIYLDVVLTCSGTTWNFVFAYSQYTDGFLQNYVQWSFSYTVGAAYSSDAAHYFYVQCVPFALVFADTNTSGAAPLTLPACGGNNYPFSATPGAITLQVAM